MKIIIILICSILLSVNLNAGVVNWTKKKVINIAKDKTKDYGKQKWKNYREHAKSTENSSNKGKITKIEEKIETIKENTTSKIKKKIGEKNTKKVEKIIDTKNKIDTKIDYMKKNTIALSKESVKKTIGTENTNKLKKLNEYKNQRLKKIDKNIVTNTENLLGTKIE